MANGRVKKEPSAGAQAPAEEIRQEEVRQVVMSEEEFQAAIAQAVKAATDPIRAELEQAKAPSVIQVTAKEEPVTLLFLDEVSEDNTIDFGAFGVINTVGGMLTVPKKDFFGAFMTPVVRQMLKRRELLVADGLSGEEKARCGCAYDLGEVLDRRTFDRLLDLDLEDLVRVFKALCVPHRELVAVRFASAYERGDNRVARTKVEALNQLSKGDYAGEGYSKEAKRGAFWGILERMNQEE